MQEKLILLTFLSGTINEGNLGSKLNYTLYKKMEKEFPHRTDNMLKLKLRINQYEKRHLIF